jgi:hypothetical protein
VYLFYDIVTSNPAISILNACLKLSVCPCVNAGHLWEEAYSQGVSESEGIKSNEGFKVELHNIVCTFVLHECGVLCWECYHPIIYGNHLMTWILLIICI